MEETKNKILTREEITKLIKESDSLRREKIDQVFPPITDNMKVHISTDIEYQIGHKIPSSMILTGGKDLPLNEYYLMKAKINPPEGTMFLIRAEKYIVHSIVGFISPAKNIIDEMSLKLKQDSSIIKSVITSIFSNQDHLRMIMDWGGYAKSTFSSIAEAMEIPPYIVQNVSSRLYSNFKVQRKTYDITENYALQAIISDNKIFPMLRKAIHSECMATRRKIYPNPHIRPYLDGQRTEVWPALAVISTELVKSEEYNPIEEDIDDDYWSIGLDGEEIY